MTDALLLSHAAATLFMCGVIAVVQAVHYPLMALAEARWLEYAAAHSRRISLVVGPAMGLEAVAALLVALAPPPGVSAWLSQAGLALLAVVWGSTAFVQVPLHARLGAGFEAGAHRRLVGTNWVRTLAWFARGALALAMLRLAGG